MSSKRRTFIAVSRSLAVAAPIALLMALAPPARAESSRTLFHYDFGQGVAGPTRVPPTAAYSKEAGFGFEPGAKLTADAGAATSDKPFFFSVAVPEGNYKVTVTLGDPKGEANTTVKAELRRLMVEGVKTAAGQTEARTFVVNVRTPDFTGGKVKLKDREQTSEARAWDDKLTLEFNGPRPAVRAIDISKVDDLPTVFILGDSTVCDQPSEPFASWGQMLTRFLKPDVAVANHAESGESLRGALGAKRLDKVLSAMKPGDYLFIQFGHNDMKVVSAADYKADLKRFVAAAKAKGGLPVVVTPVNRHSFQGEVVTNSLKDFPDAVRDVAKEENVPLIDLNAMSKTFYEAMGPQGSLVAFKTGDGTHHNNYGSYELAKCIVEGIRQNKLPLAKSVVDDFTPFDPAHPDPVAKFDVPASPQFTNVTPLGS